MARKILLADDSVTAQNMGRKILADAGYEVTTVNNGSAALKKIAESRPDLIVLDVYMPGYSGLEVCQRLKETGDTARIPILLTVGKLEPFKPEEAKRVRAEGFIVKPFEASELLSALTKLEDKIVPRSDSSKPGRFARAIAAVEEGRYDKTVSIDEDSGWKNRIAFPSKKKEKKPEPEDGDDPAIYNVVNKDLRTTVEHNPSTVSSEAKPPEAPVNVAALAPGGLPKDVTPEEIAALAAAAAQVAGVANGKSTEPGSPSPQAEANIAAAEQESAPPATPETKSEFEQTAVAETKVQLVQPAAENKAGEPQPVPESAPADMHADGATFAASKPAEETTPQVVEAATSPIERAPEAQPAPEPEPEPVTIAASSEASAERPSRWTAVAIAIAPEEANISIEDEMRLAYTAFVGAQASATANPEVAVPAAEVQHEPAPTSFAAAPAVEVAMPEVTPTLSAAAEAAHASMTAAVKEFEAVATRKIEPPVTDSPVADSTRSPERASSSPVGAPDSAEARKEELAPPVAHETGPVSVVESKAEPTDQAESSQPSLEPAPVAPEFFSTAQVAPQTAADVPAQAEPTPAPRVSEPTQPAVPEPVDQETHDSGASAAAAGASWRRIRESAAEPSSDEAAMAVAAGAEKAPQDVATDSNEAPEIASIVDSVLADLRPKIVAEISKKLGKKK